jgi:hypothetical protein
MQKGQCSQIVALTLLKPDISPLSAPTPLASPSAALSIGSSFLPDSFFDQDG